MLYGPARVRVLRSEQNCCSKCGRPSVVSLGDGETALHWCEECALEDLPPLLSVAVVAKVKGRGWRRRLEDAAEEFSARFFGGVFDEFGDLRPGIDDADEEY